MKGNGKIRIVNAGCLFFFLFFSSQAARKFNWDGVDKKDKRYGVTCELPNCFAETGKPHLATRA